uniref:Uncharacterized protein n=1 Tax=Oryza brachyantha TaxID=4533 RepID=J3MAI9_ORYBR
INLVESLMTLRSIYPSAGRPPSSEIQEGPACCCSYYVHPSISINSIDIYI